MKSDIVEISLPGKVIVIFLIVAGAAYAQPPDSLWSRTYGGVAGDYCYTMQQTTDGGYVLAGKTNSFGMGHYDFWLVKTNANGDSLWSRTFGGGNADNCNSVQQTADGGYVLAGGTFSFGAGGYDFWLVKTDANGDSLWSRTFGGGEWDECFSVQQTTDGGYVLAGWSGSFGAGGYDFWLVKTDANGDSLWSRTFGDDTFEHFRSGQQTTDGGYVLAGWTYYFGNDFWLVKTDANGDSLWSHTFGGSSDEWCYSVQQTTDGGYVLAGWTGSWENGDFWLVRTGANGDSLWSRTFGGIYDDECHSVQQTTDGGYVLAGQTWSFGAGDYDFWLVKMDANGDSLWSRTFGGIEGDLCHSMQQTMDGGYVLAGETWSFGAGGPDFWLVKTDAVTAVNDEAHAVWHHALYPAFPNPFNAVTQIQFRVEHTDLVELNVFDLQGRLVLPLASKVYPAGEHELSFDSNALATGMYFLKMQSGSFSATQKLVLLK